MIKEGLPARGRSVPCIVFRNGGRQEIQRAGEVLLPEHIGHAHLVFPAAGRGVKRRAAGEHQGLAPFGGKVGQQPFLKTERVVDGQGCHDVKGALRLAEDDARDPAELIDKQITANPLMPSLLTVIAREKEFV